MILINQNSANEYWDRSPMDNFLKKSTCLKVDKNILSQTRVPHAGVKNWTIKAPCPYSATSPPAPHLSLEAML